MARETEKKKPAAVAELPGVGESTASKLEDAGFVSLERIAVCSPAELAVAAGIGEGTAAKIISSARDALEIGYETADKVLERRKAVGRITTGSKELDALIGGGVETGSITEAFSRFSSGKCVDGKTPAAYFNDEEFHLKSLKEIYEEYRGKIGEEEFEDGHIIKNPPIKVFALTEEGITIEKADCIYRGFAEKLMEIKTKRGRRLHVTHPHKLLTLTSQGSSWKPASELKAGECIACPKTLPEPSPSKTVTDRLSEDDAYFLGFFTAEGTPNPLSITTSETRARDWLVRYIERRFGYTPTVTTRTIKEHKPTYLILLRKSTEEILHELAECKADCKHIPSKIFTSEASLKKAFLAGYIEGDGYLGTEVELSTKSKRLTTELFYLLAGLGIRATLRRHFVRSRKYQRMFIVGEDRKTISTLPYKFKEANRYKESEVRTGRGYRHTEHGYPRQLLDVIRGIYKQALGGRRGHARKIFGQRVIRRENETLWSLLFRGKPRITANTFQKYVELFERGKTYLRDLCTEADNLEKTDRNGHIGFLKRVPFPVNSLALKLGVTKRNVNNWLWRGIPAKYLKSVAEEIRRELSERRKVLESGLRELGSISRFEWDEIEAVEEVPYNDYVYDFVVSNGHTFVGGNIPTILHNTQLAFQLCVNVQLPKEQGGLGSNAMFIDTEGSLPYNEKILVETPKGIERIEIGKLVESALAEAAKKKRITQLGETLSTEENPLAAKAVSFDPQDYRIKTFSITGFIKHAPKKVYEVRLASGRKVRVTEYHNFFALNKDGELETTSTSQIKRGARIAVAGRIPIPSMVEEIDLSDFLEGERLWIRGGEDFPCALQHLKTELRELSRKRFGCADQANNWLSRCAVPLDIFNEIKARFNAEQLRGLKIGGWSRKNNIPLRLKLSKGFLKFLGLYTAKGSCVKRAYSKNTTANKVIITNTKREVEEFVKNFGQSIGLVFRRSKNDIYTQSKAFAAFIKRLDLGDSAQTKRAPNWILNAGADKVREFIEGYVVGNGSRDLITGTTNCETTSIQLAEDILTLSQSLGTPARNTTVIRTCTKTGRPLKTFNIHWQTTQAKSSRLEEIPNDRKQIAALLQAARKKLCFSQAELAKRSGLNSVVIDQIENGSNHSVRKSTLRKILPVLGSCPEAEKIKQLVESDIWFDEVVEVVAQDVEPVYDIEVLPDGKSVQNFVGGYGNVILHNTFRPDRVAQIAQTKGLDPEEILKGIYVVRAYNSDHQMLLAEKAEDIIRENNVKLIVVDSLTSLFRADYTGRGTLAERQQKLNKHVHVLQKLADVYGLAVYVTNQVLDRPDILFGDPTAPVGGNILAHASTYRLYLRRSKEDRRIAKLVDSPHLPEGEALFRVSSAGICDVEE